MSVLNGTALDDLLLGTAESESLFGFEGADTIGAGAGNDTVEGGLGNDWLSGGDGRDMVSYMNAAGGVVVRLHERGSASGADGRDAFWYGEWPYTLDFEDARGSAFADMLYGSRTDNLLRASSKSRV
jgi:Ca2+-binding RTX toxin-like protein